VTDVAGCLRFAPGATHSTWRPGDPWPAAALGLDLLRRGATKVGHRTTGLARTAGRVRRP
jgi:hypothetical protein